MAPPTRPEPRRTVAPRDPRATLTPTRRTLARRDRDARQRQVLIFGAAGLAVLCAVILVVFWALETYVRGNDVVAVVNGESITARELLEEIRPQVQSIDAQARRILGGERRAAAASQIEAQKRQLPDQVLNRMIEHRLLRQEATRRGLVITSDQVESQIREEIAEFEALTAQVDNPEAQASPVPAPGASPTSVPTLEPAAHEAAFRRRLEATGLNERQYRAETERELMVERLREAFDLDVPVVQEQVRARHILVPNEDLGRQALARLEGGADFATVAAEMSTDPGTKDKGGDLGWFPRGVMHDEFQTAAFGLQPGQRSAVVRSPSGYHVIEVIERDAARPLEESMLDSLRQRAFSTWFSTQRTSPQVRPDLSGGERDWVLRQIGVRP